MSWKYILLHVTHDQFFFFLGYSNYIFPQIGKESIEIFTEYIGWLYFF